VLTDVAARFGPVTTVSTTHLNTDNHSPGSTRDKLHTSCKAVDFKVQGPLQEVLAYLRTRKEVNGINSYRNNLIHIDFNERQSVAGAARRGSAGPGPPGPGAGGRAVAARRPKSLHPRPPEALDRGSQGAVTSPEPLS
jgi:hypothetical protein